MNGILLHVVLNEAESEDRNRLDGGTLGAERKLFYRELIARFGHVNGLKWNIAEEHNPGFSTATVKRFASYIRSTDPYGHPIGVHNYQGRPIEHDVQDVFDPFFGDSNFDYLSIQYRPAQYGSPSSNVDVISHLRNDSSNAGRPLALMFDEVEHALPKDDETHNLSKRFASRSGAEFLRKAVLWHNYLGGAGGVDWILADLLNTHDFRPFEALWGYTRHARKFIDQIPLADMTPSHPLLRGETKYTVPMYNVEGAVLAKPGEVYAIYLPDGSSDDNSGGPPELDLRDYAGVSFELKWYDPRTGEFAGDAVPLAGGDWVRVGYTPSGVHNTDDWAAVVTKL